MAPRTRKYYIRYGGEFAGYHIFGNQTIPAYMGEHSCTDETHPGPPYRQGGPFLVKKKKVFIRRLPHFKTTWNNGAGVYYDGKMCVLPYVPVDPQPLSLVGWGARGFSRTIPTHPIYNLGVSIGELKDLPGMVSQTLRGFQALKKLDLAYASGFPTVRDFIKHAKSLPKNTGDTYLYGAFGLYPMLQDLLFLLKMREKLDKKIDWLRRHNGKAVRREIELDAGGFSEDIPRNVARAATVFPSQHTEIYAPGWGDVLPFPILKTYQRRIWFAAKYRFYIPDLGKDRTKPPPGGLASDLLGLSPDVSIIYKLTPWSWLLDWFTSVGPAISNVYQMARYGVVAEYAYVMCSEHFTYKAPGDISMYTGDYGVVGFSPAKIRHFSGVSSTEYEFRQREVANPYGFGVTYASLSTYQWSILAALGLSRRGKHSAPRA